MADIGAMKAEPIDHSVDIKEESIADEVLSVNCNQTEEHLTIKYEPIDDPVVRTGQFSCKVCDHSFTEDRFKDNSEERHCPKCGSLDLEGFTTREILFICSVCEKTFSSKFSLQNHMALHSEEGETHQVTNTSDKAFACKFCDDRFSSREAWKLHQAKCKDKSKQYTSGPGITESFKASRLTGKHDCLMCGTSIVHGNDWNTVWKHYVLAHQLYPCLECDKVLTSAAELVNHQCAHKGGVIYPCGLCDKVFKRKSDKEQHERTHTGEKPFNCDDCGKSFSQKACLKKHQKSPCNMPRINESLKESKQAVKPDVLYPCGHCSKVFKGKFNLKQHERIHTGEKPFNCVECGKSFIQKAHLQSHQKSPCNIPKINDIQNIMKSHSSKDLPMPQSEEGETRQVTVISEKAFACKFCKNRFSLKLDLKLHLITCEEKYKQYNSTSGINDSFKGGVIYTCGHCGKVFKGKFEMKQHERTHTGEKPFKCADCGKGFNQKGHLQKHQKSPCNIPRIKDMRKIVKSQSPIDLPMPETDFPCSMCNKGFRQKRLLDSHMVTHSEYRAFQCPKCQEAFKRKDHLRRHQQTQKCGGVVPKDGLENETENDGAEDARILEAMNLFTEYVIKHSEQADPDLAPKTSRGIIRTSEEAVELSCPRCGFTSEKHELLNPCKVCFKDGLRPNEVMLVDGNDMVSENVKLEPSFDPLSP